LLENANIADRIKKFIQEESASLASLPGQDDEYEQHIKDVFPFDEPTLDRLFDAPADKFQTVLMQEATELYNGRESAFTPDIMRIVERDIYFQTLDNMWMQHLENMDHLRQGIHWTSVGQRDPLVEYRKRAQAIFETMQNELRRTVLRSIMHAMPVDQPTTTMHETDLTRAARRSIDNADTITEAEIITEKDFKPAKAVLKGTSTKKKRAARKAERKNRKKSRH
jgi:preprotein translocase subunit SecA